MDLLRGYSRRILRFALVLSIVSAVFLAVGPSDSHAVQYTLTPLNLGANTYNGIGNIIGGAVSPQIVGAVDYEAFYYDGAAPNTYSLGLIAESFGVNGNGIYVGTAFNDDGFKKPFVSSAGYLPDPNGYAIFDIEGRGINNAGIVVGYGLEIGGSGLFTAFQWDAGGNGSVINVGGSSTQAFGINNSGAIVGAVDGFGFILDGGSFSTFGAMSAAYGINNSGTIVGQGSGGSFVCNGNVCELIESPQGWTGLQVTGINDDGTIIGFGMQPTGKQAYFTGNIFVPEPGILSLLVAGIALIPVMRKRIGL
jgi:hypothetical protein